MNTLPTLHAIHPSTEQPVLVFDDHAALTVSPDTAPLLCPLPTGDALLLMDWQAPESPACLIPASLLEVTRRALRLEVQA